jgi:anaerobic selenocysteine-containing dehydrogenase
VLARDEEPQPTTQESMFNFVRLSDGGEARYTGPRAEVALIADLARRTLGERSPLDFRAMESHRTIRAMIAAIIPGYAAVGEIDDRKQEFFVEGRLMHRPRFATESGRARFHAAVIPEPVGEGPGELRLMTIRSEGQFNTVVYEEEDTYRGQERRDVVLMNPEDMRRMDLSPDDRVTVRSATGEMRGLLAREADIRAGNAAAYYPEANVLVPRHADGHSGTPAFKNIPVTVTRDATVRLQQLAPHRH